jgi:BirA family biotin operon repressor/biotin-[acetyl-CoA-carboxylase] ligase
MLVFETVLSGFPAMGNARFSLLRTLADGAVHSRETVGAALGLSQAELHQLAVGLDALGVQVRSAGDEIRLEERVDLYDATRLARRVERESPGLHLELVDECPSTNTELIERARSGAVHGSVLACEHQSAGRGRRGNGWVSAVGGSVAFSILWRFPRGAGALSGLSLAVAVAAAEALEKLGAREVSLKWPNDLLCGGRKLGGILIETAGEGGGSVAAVIGIGVNLRLDAAARERVGRPVTDLAEEGAPPSRTDALAGLLASIAPALDRFSREGFAPFRQAWLRRHAWQGRRVVLVDTGQRIAEGEAIGIAEDGALELTSERGLERFHSGELSLRLG